MTLPNLFFATSPPGLLATRGLGFLLQPWKLENLSRNSSWFISTFSESHRFYPSKRFSHTRYFWLCRLLQRQPFTQKSLVFLSATIQESVKYEYNLSPGKGVFICTIGILWPTGEFIALTQHRFHFTAIKVFLLPNGSTHQMDCISRSLIPSTRRKDFLSTMLFQKFAPIL